MIESLLMKSGVRNNLDDIAQQYAHVGRQYWYPRNQLSTSLPVEWNHWWSYEDADINEAVFLANAESPLNLALNSSPSMRAGLAPANIGINCAAIGITSIPSAFRMASAL